MSSNVVTGGWADGCVGENSETICLHHRVALVTATLQTQRGNGHKWNAVDASSFQNVSNVLNMRNTGVGQWLRVCFRKTSVTVKFKREKQWVSFDQKSFRWRCHEVKYWWLDRAASQILLSVWSINLLMQQNINYLLNWGESRRINFFEDRPLLLSTSLNASRRVCVVLLLCIL